MASTTTLETLIPGANQTFEIQHFAGYLAADIDDRPHRMTVYLHEGRIVGVTR
jgi:hypothetical protein